MGKVASFTGQVNYVRKPVAQKSNLLRNSNFARATKTTLSSNTTNVHRWTVSGLVNVTDTAVDDKRCVVLSCTPASILASIDQTLNAPLVSGATYTLSAWVKTNSASFSFKYKDASGNHSTALTKQSLGIKDWSDWTYIQYTFSPSSSISSVGFALAGTSGNYTLSLCMLKLEEGRSASEYTFHDLDYTIVPTPRGYWEKGTSDNPIYYYNGEPGSDEASIVIHNNIVVACKKSHVCVSDYDASLWDDGGYFKAIATEVFFANLAFIKKLALNYAAAYPYNEQTKTFDEDNPTIEISGKDGTIKAINGVFENAKVTGNVSTPCFFGNENSGDLLSGIDKDGTFFCGYYLNNDIWTFPIEDKHGNKSFSNFGAKGFYTYYGGHITDEKIDDGTQYDRYSIRLGKYSVDESYFMSPTDTNALGGNINNHNTYKFLSCYEIDFQKSVGIGVFVHDNNSVGLYARSPSSLINSYAIKTDGKAYIGGDLTSTGKLLSSGETHVGGGLFIDNIGSALSNDLIKVAANQSITLPSASSNKGRVLFIRGSGGSGKVYGNILPSDNNTATTQIELGSRSIILISDGSAWIHFNCE